MQQPEIAQGNHAFRFVVVVGVVARAAAAADARRFFARVARLRLCLVRVHLDGERQAHVKDFQQIGQAVAIAAARGGGEHVIQVFLQPVVKRQGDAVRFDLRRRLRVVAKPQFGGRQVARFAPQQLRDVVMAAPGVGLDGAVQSVDHGWFSLRGLMRCCSASSPVKKAAACSRSSMRATGRMRFCPPVSVKTSTPSSERRMAVMALYGQ